jgi:methylenetetrahydrofolate reductase (NADPH)
VEQVIRMNNGHYQDDLIDAAHTDFCIGVSFYPEKHFEAPNLKFDMDVLLRKQQAGACYGVSQMFFSNDVYHNYVDESRKAGIHIPLIPGLKILNAKSQLTVIPSIFHVDLPEELTERMLKADTKEKQVEVGVDWAYKQTLDLLDKGVPCVHFYIMQNTQPFVMLMEKLKKKI